MTDADDTDWKARALAAEAQWTFCDFCGRHRDFVSVMITAPMRPGSNTSPSICGECVDACAGIVKKRREEADVGADGGAA